MVNIINSGVYLINSSKIIKEDEASFQIINEILKKEKLRGLDPSLFNKETLKKNTITYKILSSHNTSNNDKNLKLKFDALASHDITYVSIIQTARASNLKEFPIPYILTNCHNSLCAVGGTINEDDHIFGLSACKKYGGIFVPAHLAVIHQYVREKVASCGKMVLGSDSHTRYGALGCMGIGEGGGEIVKQLLGKTYDINYPEVILVYLENNVRKGVGPQDVALAIIKAVFENGFVKNKIMEFVGPGVKNLSVDFRNGIDVMTTETTCLSSIWETDDKVKEYYKIHNRVEEFKYLKPTDVAYYDGALHVDLSKIEPMIALPFHPSNAYPITEVNKQPKEFLEKIEEEARSLIENLKINFSLKNKIEKNRLKVDQGIIAGCAGGLFENIVEAGRILKNGNIGNSHFSLSIYPASQPIYLELVKNGIVNDLMKAGVVIKTAFCGPCFGAGDTPFNEGFSVRHTTRNFPNREGSKPNQGQIAYVALMDARSIAATSLNKGLLTPATEINYDKKKIFYHFDNSIYENRVYDGYKKADKNVSLIFGPNIADWPEMIALPEHLILKVATVINDPVTTTDELIPSGETSSYRSNPLKLAEFTLSRKDPEYVKRAKAIQLIELERQKLANGNDVKKEILKELEDLVCTYLNVGVEKVAFGSVVVARKPGDGSAREQAASCQKVLGGWANIAIEYATKRYRSNLINWGMLPFTIQEKEFELFSLNDYIIIPKVKQKIRENEKIFEAILIKENKKIELQLYISDLTQDEKDIIIAGSLINYYKK